MRSELAMCKYRRLLILLSWTLTSNVTKIKQLNIHGFLCLGYCIMLMRLCETDSDLDLHLYAGLGLRLEDRWLGLGFAPLCWTWTWLCWTCYKSDGLERKFNACQTPRSMYLSIFNSFRVIRCFSQCVSPKIAIFNTFLFPLGMPLGQSR